LQLSTQLSPYAPLASPWFQLRLDDSRALGVGAAGAVAALVVTRSAAPLLTAFTHPELADVSSYDTVLVSLLAPRHAQRGSMAHACTLFAQPASNIA
jgi:hypothetical protein